MEYVDGATLLEILDRGQPLEEGPALRIILEVSDVLRYLHAQGVIHRDVKPGNIMLSSAGRVKLIDLGFAAAEQVAANPENSAVGTVAYLSPEQARGGAAADLRSDIYSLGVTLFQLVVGRLPFDSSDDREVLRMQVKESLSSPELKGRKLSPHLHYFIEKMMAKDKDVRYQSWQGLVEDIEGQLEGRATLDYRSDGGSRLQRRRGPSTGRR
jgi:serine/threonine-protein kinase